MKIKRVRSYCCSVLMVILAMHLYPVGRSNLMAHTAAPLNRMRFLPSVHPLALFAPKFSQ